MAESARTDRGRMQILRARNRAGVSIAIEMPAELAPQFIGATLYERSEVTRVDQELVAQMGELLAQRPGPASAGARPGPVAACFGALTSLVVSVATAAIFVLILVEPARLPTAFQPTVQLVRQAQQRSALVITRLAADARGL